VTRHRCRMYGTCDIATGVFFENMIAIMFEGLDRLLWNVARRELTATPGEKVVFQDDPVRYVFFVTVRSNWSGIKHPARRSSFSALAPARSSRRRHWIRLATIAQQSRLQNLPFGPSPRRICSGAWPRSQIWLSSLFAVRRTSSTTRAFKPGCC